MDRVIENEIKQLIVDIRLLETTVDRYTKVGACPTFEIEALNRKIKLLEILTKVEA